MVEEDELEVEESDELVVLLVDDEPQPDSVIAPIANAKPIAKNLFNLFMHRSRETSPIAESGPPLKITASAPARIASSTVTQSSLSREPWI